MEPGALRTGTSVATDSGDRNDCVTYNTPADDWHTGLYLGNGRLGAMWIGSHERKRFALNHKRIWQHNPPPLLEPVSHYLPRVRELILAGKWKEAEELFCQKMQPIGCDAVGSRLNLYQPAGDLVLQLQGIGEAGQYVRTLNLDRAIATECFSSNGARFQCDSFVSAVHQVVAVHLACDTPGRLDAQVTLQRQYDPMNYSVSGRFDGRALTLLGHGRVLDFRFAIAARVVHKGGRINPAGYQDGGRSSLRIAGADEVWVVLAIATEDESDDPLGLCNEHLNAAESALHELMESHVNEHRRLYRRASLHLGALLPDKPTDAFVEELRAAEDIPPAFYALLSNYARYLLISCSRPGSWPANNQGIWNDYLSHPEEIDMHLDLNLQQIYWPCEVFNLGECHMAFLDFLRYMVPLGQEAARKLFSCRGVYLGHAVDGQAAVFNGPWSAWTGAAAWCAQHFWHHWEYTQDRTFLREQAYPFLKEVGTFYLDFLIKDDGGYYITCPSVSPEQVLAGRDTQLFGRPTGWSLMGRNATMDIALIREIFSNLLVASEVLDVDAGLRPGWHDVLDHLAPWSVDEKQGIREFPMGQEPVADVNFWAAQFIIPAQLYGFFPGDSISVEETPELIEAVRKALFLRPLIGIFGEGQPWRACCCARLGDARNALCVLDDVIKHSFSKGLCGVNNWGLCPPDKASAFVPDINTGVAMAVAEMLLQSHRGIIRLLPALPAGWTSGELCGWRARGGFELDFSWKEGRLQSLRIISTAGGPCHVRLCRPAPPVDIRDAEGGRPKVKSLAENEFVFDTVLGGEYMLF